MMKLSSLNLLLLAVRLVSAAPGLTSYTNSAQLTPYLNQMQCGNAWQAGPNHQNPPGKCVEAGCTDECRHGALISGICPDLNQQAQDCCVRVPCGADPKTSFCLNKDQKCVGGTLSEDQYCNSGGDMGCCVLDKPTHPDGKCAPSDKLSILCGNFPTDPCCAPRKTVQKPNPPAAEVGKPPAEKENEGKRGRVVGPDDGPPKRIEYTDGCSGMFAWFGWC